MKKTVFVLTGALLLSSFSLAQRMNRIKGNGVVSEKTIKTKDYEEIKVAGPFDVILTDGKEGSILVEADENLHDILEIEVNGNTLRIGIARGVDIRKYKKLQVKVPVEHIDELSLTGSGEISTNTDLESERMHVNLTGSGDIELDIKCEALTTSLTGSGDIALSGTTIDADYTLTGSGDYDCYGMKAKRVDAVVSGSGDIQLYAEEKLSAHVSGSGDIYYKGDPKQQKANVAGSGSIESR